jgi:type III secretory pathway component EscR
MIEIALRNYNKLFEKALPILQRRTKASYISIAIFLVIIQQIYSILRVPKNLRHFPEVSLLSMIRSLYINEPIVERTKRLVTPLTNAGHGFYVVSTSICLLFYLTLHIAQIPCDLDSLCYRPFSC